MTQGWPDDWRLSEDYAHTPAEDDIPGLRWTYTGRPGTELEGCILTVSIEDEHLP